MDFKQLKAGIKDIADIASSVPEPFRNKCFEVLLIALLAEQSVDRGADSGGKGGNEKDKKDDEKKPPAGDKIPIKSQLRVFMTRTKVTEDELNKVALFEDGEVHFIQMPHPKKIREGQLEWSLLLALKNAILRNAAEADPEEIRSKCIDAGFYDKANFAANFKAPKFSKLFKDPLVAQGKASALTPEGQDALGELVKRLAAETK